MEFDQPRRTLARPVVIQGVGLHSGQPVECQVKPGRDGVAFWWQGERIPALASQVTGTFQRTQLGPVHTVEHLLAALVFCGLTDAEVELSSPEPPGVDGSAGPLVAALLEGGAEELEPKRLHALFARVHHLEEGCRVSVSAGEGHFKYVFDTGSRWPGVQEAECWLADLEACRREIAPARTLAFEEDIPAARQAGLGRGLDESSCLVLGQAGYVNEARFPDEPARHKLLDLIGDLSLAGYPLDRLNVLAEKSGHRAHSEAALKLSQAAFGN